MCPYCKTVFHLVHSNSIDNGEWKSWITTAVSAVSTLIAAFSGAWYAFRLNSKNTKDKLIQEQVAAGNRAIFMLLRQFNELSAIQNKLINPHRDDPQRYVSMSPALAFEFNHLRVDVNSISFLLESDDRQVLLDIIVEEERFQTAIRAINERSEFLYQTIHPLFSKAGLTNGGVYSDAYFKEILGENHFVHLQKSTEQSIQIIDETILSLMDVGQKLRKTLIKLYPKRTIIGFSKKI